MLLVTHDLEEAQTLADRICVLHAGTTLQIGAPDEVRLRPKSALVARLMGQANLFERWPCCPVAASAGATASSTSRRLNGFSPGQRVAALIPPDFIASPTPTRRARNVVNGILTGVKPLGEMTSLTLVVDGQRLRFKIGAREAASRNMRVGDALSVSMARPPPASHLDARHSLRNAANLAARGVATRPARYGSMRRA